MLEVRVDYRRVGASVAVPIPVLTDWPPEA
jgi:hypothetical protein